MGQSRSILDDNAAKIPQITAHPADFRGNPYRIVSGESAKFFVNACGPGSLKYSWEWTTLWKEKDLLRVKGETASNVLTKYFVELTSLVDPEDVAGALFSKKIVDGEAVCRAGMHFRTPKQRATELFSDLINKVQARPEWFETACEIFETKSLPILHKLKDEFEKQLWDAEQWMPLANDSHSPDIISLGSVRKENQGRYRCVVSNHAGRATSSAVTLEIVEPLQLIGMPQNQLKLSAGSNVTFAAKASGMEPLHFCWEWKPAAEGESNWMPLSPKEEKLQGLDAPTLTISNASCEDEGSYRCKISNDTGSVTSDPALLKLAVSPQVITHPQVEEEVTPGNRVSFCIEATGTEPMQYMWEWKPAEEPESSTDRWQPVPNDAERIEGANMPKLVLHNTQGSDAGSYRCVLKNNSGSVASKLGSLAILNTDDIVSRLIDTCRDKGKTTEDKIDAVVAFVDKYGSRSETTRKGLMAIVKMEAQQNELVDTFMQKFVPVQFKENGFTLLHWACKMGHAKVALNLLKYGAVKCEQTDDDGSSSLHLAAQMGHSRVVEVLLFNEVNVNAVDTKRRTALHRVCEAARDLTDGKLQQLLMIVENLLKCEARIDITDEELSSPLHIACDVGNAALVRTLLKFDAVCKYALNCGDKDGNTPLHIACSGDFHSVVDELLNSGADTSLANHQENNTPLHVAILSRHPDVARKLAKLMKHDKRSLYSQNKDGNTPLHLAAANGYDQNVAKLLKYSSNPIDQQNGNGDTPLHLACQGGYRETIKVILNKGADATISNKAGMTPRMVAAVNCHRELNTVEGLIITHPIRRGFRRLRQATSRFSGVQVNQVADVCKTESYPSASRAFVQRTTSCSDSIDSISLPIHCGASPMKPRVMPTQTTMRSRAASEALQDCQGLLREQLNPEEVAPELFSASLIDVDIVLRAQDQSIDVQQRAQELLRHILRKAESKPSCFKSICTILEKKEVPCVQRLREIYDGRVKLLELQNACRAYDGNTKTIKSMIMESKPDSEVVQKALMYVVDRDEIHADVVKVFIVCGVPLDFERGGWTPLQRACMNGYSKTVWHLLEGGARRDIQTDDGRTLLHLACEKANSEIVSYLLFDSMGISTNDQDKLLKTPLHLACEAATKVVSVPTYDRSSSGNLRRRAAYTQQQSISMEEKELLMLIRNLLNNRARRDMQDQDENTPVHLAVKSGMISVLDELLKGTAQCRAIDLQNKLGNSPLQMAASEGFYDITEYLVECGANPELLNQDGQMAVQLAELSGHSRIAKVLRGKKRRSFF